MLMKGDICVYCSATVRFVGVCLTITMNLSVFYCGENWEVENGLYISKSLSEGIKTQKTCFPWEKIHLKN